jgi:hypothetical protein
MWTAASARERKRGRRDSLRVNRGADAGSSK